MTVISTDRTDCGREAREASVLRYASSGDHPIVMVQAPADGPGHQLAVDGLLVGEFRVRVWNPVDALMDPGTVVPVSDELSEHGMKLALVPQRIRSSETLEDRLA